MKKRLCTLLALLALSTSVFAVDKSTVLDSDGDGVADSCDLDSDNDGIPDTWEDLNHNGKYYDDDVDGDLLIVPVLGDAISTFLDLDSDNDGVPDLMESGISLSLINLYDPNHTGILTGPVGANGLLDALETFPDSGIPVYTLRNTDGDDKPDFIDLTSNGTDYDLYVSGNDSLDQLGGGFITPVTDTDLDGIVQAVDNAPAVRGTFNGKLLPYTVDYTMVSAGIDVSSGAGAACQAPTPVKLSYFSVKMLAGSLVVDWSTANETNNDHFDVEVSYDGKLFRKLRTVRSKAKNGNSTDILQYEEKFDLGEIFVSGIPLLLLSLVSFRRSQKHWLTVLFSGFLLLALYACRTEKDPTVIIPGKTVYLRLVQVDTDGTQSASRVVSVVTGNN